MGLKSNRSAAVELSIGTIVIIVLAMSMLILGMVLVRSIMCGAIGMTGNINTKVNGEINNLFEATGAEVACIGAGETPVALSPGKTNTIYCSVKAPATANYKIQVSKYHDSTHLKGGEIEKWVVGEDYLVKTITPKDEAPQKFLRLEIPDNAPSDSIRLTLKVYKSTDNTFTENNMISSPDLDFEIKSTGIIRAAVC